MTGNAAPVAIPEKTFAVDRPIVGLVLMRPMIVLLTQDRIHPFHMEVDGSAATFRSVSFLDGFALHSNASEMAFVASDSAIAFLERVPDQDLAEDLCRTRRFEAAVAVLRSPGRDPDVTGGQLMSARERDLARVYGQYADDLFQSGRYAASLKAFQQSDVDPSTVLTRFNGLSSDAMCDQTVAALMPYLLHLRSRLPRQHPPSSAAPLTPADFAVVVDTMLLRTYLKADRRLVIPFLSQSPLVDVDQAAAALTSAGQFDALLFLYESRAMHDRALSLLQGLADSTTGTLSGTLPTIHYLRRLMDEDAIHHWDLIRRHAVWALDRDPITAAVKIFAYHHRRRSSVGSGEAHRTTIGPTAIIDYLKERAPVQAAIAFLEAYIANTGTTLAPIHNELAHLYMSAILQPGAPVDAGRRMQDFLCRCQYVDLPALLQDMPADKGDLLASERAVVLHRLGRSDEALRELVEHQGALAAIGFCNTHAPSSATRLHMQLLRVFLQPAAGDPMIEPALQLLHSHYRQLDACEVVKLLPDTLPVERVRDYVEKTVGHHLEVHRRNQIEKHLCRGQHRQAHLDLYARQRPRVVVDGCGRCDSCRQPIADPNVVVVRYPNGAVIDYKCLPDL
ncbi:hypothetical protein PBRA_009226 [Plasmodiophora brassicae]|nr:hypothetical protein PBRA_009226 [Plasmodiophora brassicae]